MSTPTATGEADVHGSVAPWPAVPLRIGAHRATLDLVAVGRAPQELTETTARHPGRAHRNGAVQPG